MSETNENLNEGKKIVQSTRAEVSFLEEQFISLGYQIQNSIQNAIEGMGDLDDVTASVAETFKKDLVNSAKQSARGMEKHLALAIKIKNGQNVSKQINEGLAKVEQKREMLQARIATAKRLGIELTDDEIEGIKKGYDLEEASLENLKKKNDSLQSTKSFTKIAGENMAKFADKVDKTGTLSKILKGDLKEVFTARRISELGTAIFMKFLIEGIGIISKLQSEFNKDLGLSTDEAANLRDRMSDISGAMEVVGITSRDTQQTFMELNKQFGTASTVLRSDIVGEMARLGKFTDMSVESQGRFASTMMRSGLSAREVTFETRNAVKASEAEYGVRLNINQTLDEAGKITGVIAANLGFNVVHITKALSAAKQMGMTLQGLAGISSNLLNFQQSIENEMMAELFIGRELNLEKARLYALTADYENLAKEIKEQAGSELEFAQMNVLEKERLAQALGTSSEHLSEIMYKNMNLAELAEKARNMGDEETAEMLEKRNLQQKFNDLVSELQMTFVDLAEGPLGTIARVIEGIVSNSWLLYSIIAMVAGLKIAGLIGSLASAAVQMGILSAGAITFKGVMTGGVGLLVAAAAIGGMFALIGSMQKKHTSDIKSIKDGAIDGMGNIVASGPKNSIKLTRIDPGDQGIFGTNLFGGGDSFGNDSVKLLKNIDEKLSTKTHVTMTYSGFDAVNETTHHTTSFR